MARNLWGEAVNTACHAVNRVYFRADAKKTPYELWKGRNQLLSISESSEVLVSFSRIERMWEIDSRSNEGIFLGYSSMSKAYRVYNKRIKKVMETVNVVIDETSEKIS